MPASSDQINEDEFRPVSHVRVVESLDRPDINDITEFDICLTKKTSVEERTENLFQHQGQELVQLEDFEIKKVLGRGSFGKVYLVQNINTKEVFAMKALRKDLLLERHLVNATIQEKKVLLEGI